MISLHVGEGLLMKFSSTELRTEVKMLVFGELKILIYVMLVSHHCLWRLCHLVLQVLPVCSQAGLSEAPLDYDCPRVPFYLHSSSSWPAQKVSQTFQLLNIIY